MLAVCEFPAKDSRLFHFASMGVTFKLTGALVLCAAWAASRALLQGPRLARLSVDIVWKVQLASQK